MADVYLAHDVELDRDVAVKVLAARFAENADLRRRFQREALTAARLSGSAHIVTIFDVAEADGRPLIVMELLTGGSLEQRAQRMPCAPDQVVDWLDEAALALDEAHAAGVVHRDVKPGNLLLDEAGHVKVADFGIASAAGLDSLTQTGTILGTAGYLAPEQARGEHATSASDRYALAVVAWELLAGRRPFEGGSATTEANAHVHAPVPAITRTKPDLPRTFDAIFTRALAKDPARRYPTAAEFVGDLRRALHEDAADTWSEPRFVGIRAPSRWPVALLLLALGVLGAVAAVLAFRGGSPEGETTVNTVVRTVTQPGTTVQETVRSPAPTSSASGASLNDAGFARMRAHDFAGALPLLEQAVQKLQGTGALTEAYADYNLAFTRFALGRCTDVLPLLDASERIQGHRAEISQLRHDARKTCER
jgi:serine/threonine-protein kinase